MATGDRFDAAYYARFYGRRPVHDLRRISRLGEAVFGLAAWWRLPLRSVLDVGAGKGYWRDWLSVAHPTVRYRGLDVSEHACRRYGHERVDLATWTADRRADLVVCQSVLQYMDDAGAESAMEQIGRAARTMLFLEVPTVADRRSVIDPAATDLDVNWRTGEWYRSRLAPWFREVGAGIWVSREAGLPLFELEAPADPRASR